MVGLHGESGRHCAFEPAFSPPALRAAAWPLAGRCGTVSRVREPVDAFLERCEPPPTDAGRTDAMIVLGGLVSNAVRHAPGPCTVILTERADSLTVAVRDTSGAAPRSRRPDLVSGTGGFGRRLLRSLATGVQVERHPGGRTVAARVPSMRVPVRPAVTRARVAEPPTVAGAGSIEGTGGEVGGVVAAVRAVRAGLLTPYWVQVVELVLLHCVGLSAFARRRIRWSSPWPSVL